MSHFGLSFVCLIMKVSNVSQVGLSLTISKGAAPKVSQHGILSAGSDSRHTAKLAIMVTIRSVKFYRKGARMQSI